MLVVLKLCGDITAKEAKKHTSQGLNPLGRGCKGRRQNKLIFYHTQRSLHFSECVIEARFFAPFCLRLYVHSGTFAAHVSP